VAVSGLGLDDLEFVLVGCWFPALISAGSEWADEDVLLLVPSRKRCMKVDDFCSLEACKHEVELSSPIPAYSLPWCPLHEQHSFAFGTDLTLH